MSESAYTSSSPRQHQQHQQGGTSSNRDHNSKTPPRPLNPTAISYESSRVTPPPQPIAATSHGFFPATTSSSTSINSPQPPQVIGSGGGGGPTSMMRSSPPSIGGPPPPPGTLQQQQNGNMMDTLGGGDAMGVDGAHNSSVVGVDRAYLQQQVLAEREFHVTRSMLPHVSRPALVAVLTSMLDDNPQLAPLIRYRCEKAMAAVAAQQQHQFVMEQQHQGGGGGSVTPPSQRRQGHRASSGGGGGGGPSSNTTSRNSGGHRNEDEPHEFCSVHGNLRSLKHLVFRTATGSYECIPGFHCLVSSAPPSNSVTPKKESYTAYTSSYGYPSDVAGVPPSSSSMLHLGSGGTDMSSASPGGGANTSSTGYFAYPITSPQRTATVPVPSHDPHLFYHHHSTPPPLATTDEEAPDLDVAKLQNLLHNVRQLGS